MGFFEEMPEMATLIEKLGSFFDKDRIEAEAREAKFIQRPRKLTGVAFLGVCVMQSFGQSLSMLCGMLGEFSITMCEQSLHERFSNNALWFMKRLFGQMLEIELSGSGPMNFLSKFSGVFIQDSTVVKLPDGMAGLFKGTGGSAGASSVKLDFWLDVQGTACWVDVRAGASSDNTQPVSKPRAGALYLRDLGYFNMAFFVLIVEAGAYFLSRLKSKTAVYGDKSGKTVIDIGALAKKLRVDETLSISAFIGSRKFVPVSLLIQKLPPEVVAAKIARVKKDRHKRMTKVTKETLEWCEFNSYVTNIPLGWFDALTVIKIYAIRWQIEIIFKVWKSIFKIAEIGKMNACRIQCMLYGKLIWVLMHMKVFRVLKKNIYGVSQKELSELGAFKHMEGHKEKFKAAILSGTQDMWRALILFLLGLVRRLAVKKKRKKAPPPLYNIDLIKNTQ
jgi:hypothetical protein